MTDRPIPESVRAKADEIARRYFPAMPDWYAMLQADIASALMEAEEAATARERERAAKIALGEDRNVAWTGREIAAAIREGE